MGAFRSSDETRSIVMEPLCVFALNYHLGLAKKRDKLISLVGTMSSPVLEHAVAHAPHIHRFPPEIILEVLVMLLDDNSRNMIYPSHVCRLWRRLIIQSPSLWTCIVLGDDDEEEYDVVPYLVTVVERASGHPLSLSIGPNNELRKPSELLDDVTVMAGECRERIYGPHEWLLPEGVVDFRPFTQLRSLTLDSMQDLVRRGTS
ncbi:unnamed protein product [Cyclocybe aegerita]|uniref:F-box domain-containing protein n=1 Tax=Cyclocybe aegerita TaxID=1973307 RepID=A0A8S0VU90_CYCAE|nr:unnamed protein product [Cyclocybe aegerita]